MHLFCYSPFLPDFNGAILAVSLNDHFFHLKAKQSIFAIFYLKRISFWKKLCSSDKSKKAPVKEFLADLRWILLTMKTSSSTSSPESLILVQHSPFHLRQNKLSLFSLYDELPHPIPNCDSKQFTLNHRLTFVFKSLYTLWQKGAWSRN